MCRQTDEHAVDGAVIFWWWGRWPHRSVERRRFVVAIAYQQSLWMFLWHLRQKPISIRTSSQCRVTSDLMRRRRHLFSTAPGYGLQVASIGAQLPCTGTVRNRPLYQARTPLRRRP